MFKQEAADISNPQTVEALISKAGQIATKLRKQTTFYSDERAAAGKVSFVAEPGKRLRRKFPIIIIVVGLYILLNILFRFVFSQ